MRIRRFEAPDSKTALAMVKAELGDDAVILANRTIPADGGLLRKYGRTVVEVVAATDYDLYSLAGYSDGGNDPSRQEAVHFTAEEPKKSGAVSFDALMARKRPANHEPLLSAGKAEKKRWPGGSEKNDSLPTEKNSHANPLQKDDDGRRAVVSSGAGIGPQAASRAKPKNEDVLRWREQLIGQIRYNPLPRKGEGSGQRIIAVVGATGVGKTTTVAKIAAWARLRDGLKVALVSMDCFRIGATDQLRTYAKIMRLPCEIALKEQDLIRVVEKHRDCDLVIIDTAGKSPYDEGHIRELFRWFGSIPKIEPYLAVSATTKKEDLQAVLEMYAPLSVQGLVLTKLDETRAYATLCQQIVASGYPVSCLCVGQRVPEDFLLASDNTVGKLFREGWHPFIGTYAGNDPYDAVIASSG